jgi:hypothetical protein
LNPLFRLGVLLLSDTPFPFFLLILLFLLRHQLSFLVGGSILASVIADAAAYKTVRGWPGAPLRGSPGICSLCPLVNSVRSALRYCGRERRHGGLPQRGAPPGRSASRPRCPRSVTLLRALSIGARYSRDEKIGSRKTGLPLHGALPPPGRTAGFLCAQDLLLSASPISIRLLTTVLQGTLDGNRFRYRQGGN